MESKNLKSNKIDLVDHLELNKKNCVDTQGFEVPSPLIKF
jgi:hypothetical protein